ncbi:MAG: DUF721 domain-containing protein [Kofleriaceae bacterium]
MKPKPRRRPVRAREVTPAAKAVAAALAYHGLSDHVRAGRLDTEWSELVGPRIAQRTRADGIHERVLWIEVATSAWLHELNLLRTQLVKGLVDRLGEPRLFDDVKFKLAGRKPRDPVTLRTHARPVPPVVPFTMPATGAARERIVNEVASVDDDELRELIARVRITHDR